MLMMFVRPHSDRFTFPFSYRTWHYEPKLPKTYLYSAKPAPNDQLYSAKPAPNDQLYSAKTATSE